MTVSVIENCCHRDKSGRQIEFNLNSDGEVFIRVYSGLREINIVNQKNIFVRTNAVKVQHLDPVGIKRLPAKDKIVIVEAIKHSMCEILPENGKLTNVLKRKTATPVYFHKVKSITVVVDVIQSFCYTGECGRQLEFHLSSNKEISVRIHRGLREINELYQENIFVQSSEASHQCTSPTCIEKKSPTDREIIFNDIKKHKYTILLKDGKLTTVRGRDIKNPVYLSEIEKITLIRKQSYLYEDKFKRQVEFYLSFDSTVSASVYYGSRDINTVYQDKIFVQFPKLSDIKIKPVSLDSQPPIVRDFVFSIIKNSTCNIKLTNGKLTNVHNESTDNPVFFREVEKITLIMK